MTDTQIKWLKFIIEKKILECADINTAPFGYNLDESHFYLSGKASGLQWVLEMMPTES